MKKHNLLKILLLVCLGVALLTWILPVTYFNDGIKTAAREPVGLFDLFGYPYQTLNYFSYLIVFILVVGGFYGVLSKTGAYRNMLDKIVKGFKKKESIFLVLTVTILSVLVSVVGFNITVLFFLPLIVSLILLMGFNKVVAALTIVGSYTVGLIGATYTNLLSTYSTILTVNYNTEILTKLILLVLGIILLSFNLVAYTKKNKKEKEIQDENLVPEKVTTKKAKWPLIVIIDLIIVLMILGFMNWSSAFGIELFEDIHETMKQVALGENKFFIFDHLLGQVNAFGAWSEVEAISLLLIASLVVGLTYKLKVSDIFVAFKEGAKKFVYPSILMMLIYAVLMMIAIHPVMLTFLKPMLTLTKGFNIATSSIAAFVAAGLNGEHYYTVNSIVPYLVELANNKDLNPLVLIVTQSMFGVAQLVLPTGIILVCTLSYLDVSYKTWLKNVWKFLVELLVILFIVFIILMLSL